MFENVVLIKQDGTEAKFTPEDRKHFELGLEALAIQLEKEELVAHEEKNEK